MYSLHIKKLFYHFFLIEKKMRKQRKEFLRGY